MARKVVIIGYKNSGKTTYLAGMYATMKGAIGNFSLRAKESDMDLRLDTLWNQIKEGTPPPPTAAKESESYVFQLIHNLERNILEFEWLDYPGAFLDNTATEQYQRLLNNIVEADCLIVVVNGDYLVVDNPAPISLADYKARLSNQLQANPELNAEIACLNALATRKFPLPSIAIVVTKSDLIDVQYADIFRDVLRQRFTAIFGASGRVVMQVAVSLGGSIQANFIPRPSCLEQLIMFAGISILIKAIRRAQNSIKKNANIVNASFSDLVNSLGYIFFPIGYLVAVSRRREAGAKILILREKIPIWAKDCLSLINAFPDNKMIYVGGTANNLREHYAKVIQELSSEQKFSELVEEKINSQEIRQYRNEHDTEIIKNFSAEFPIMD